MTTPPKKIVPLSDRPRSGPYSGLNARSAKRFLEAQFTEAGLPTPDIDARILVLEATGFSAADLITQGTDFLSQEVYARIDDFARRRLSGEPVDHILGRRGFYGRDFKVTKDVLSPRPDSEILIDRALAALDRIGAPNILDLGTGSGALIITLLAERSGAGGYGTDISKAALDVARYNARVLGVDARLSWLQSDWFAGLERTRFDLIISNPPYIDDKAMAALSPEVAEFDPTLALAGGADGLDAYRVLAAQAGDYLKPGGTLVLEIGYDQAKSVAALLSQAGWTDIHLSQDLAGLDRCLCARKVSA